MSTEELELRSALTAAVQAMEWEDKKKREALGRELRTEFSLLAFFQSDSQERSNRVIKYHERWKASLLEEVLD